VIWPGEILPSVIDPPSTAYMVECYDEVQVEAEGLALNHVYDIDLLRCKRATYGDFVFKAADSNLSDADMIVLPWLEWVGGDVRVQREEGGVSFDTLKLSRLAHIGGKLEIDFNPMFEGLRLPSLTTVSAVDIELRELDLDLTGLDTLE